MSVSASDGGAQVDFLYIEPRCYGFGYCAAPWPVQCQNPAACVDNGRCPFCGRDACVRCGSPRQCFCDWDERHPARCPRFRAQIEVR